MMNEVDTQEIISKENFVNKCSNTIYNTYWFFWKIKLCITSSLFYLNWFARKPRPVASSQAGGQIHALAGRPLSAVPPEKPSFTSCGWDTPHTVQSIYNCLIMCFSWDPPDLPPPSRRPRREVEEGQEFGGAGRSCHAEPLNCPRRARGSPSKAAHLRIHSEHGIIQYILVGEEDEYGQL